MIGFYKESDAGPHLQDRSRTIPGAVLCCLVATFVLVSAGRLAYSDPAPARPLAAFPFWVAMQGSWAGENTYLDGEMNYRIRTYNTLRRVTLDGSRMIELEVKFYAPSPLASVYGQGKLAEGEGVEVVSQSVYRAADTAGTVQLVESRPVFAATAFPDTLVRVLSADTGIRVSPTPTTGVDAYRMLITLPTSDRCYRVNLGLVSGAGPVDQAHPSKGDLHGVSVFRDRRIDLSDWPTLEAEYRQQNNVAAIVQSDDQGHAVVRRLDGK